MPCMRRFGGGVQPERLALARAERDELQVGFAIGAIQADDEVKRRASIHSLIEFGVMDVSSLPQA
jgi:hypothetical protein